MEKKSLLTENVIGASKAYKKIVIRIDFDECTVSNHPVYGLNLGGIQISENAKFNKSINEGDRASSAVISLMQRTVPILINNKVEWIDEGKPYWIVNSIN